MSSPDANVFDVVPPNRPGLNDFEGADLEDDVEEPPNPLIDPTSAVWNTICRTLAAVGGVVPIFRLGITGHATQPFINALASVCSAHTQVPVSGHVFGSFTILRNSIGNVTISWDDTLVPDPAFPPYACLNASDAGMITVPPGSTNAVVVITRDHSGSLADLSFTLTVG